MVSKTKNRILQAARVLFNEEGESHVALVDIAAVLDISPGNLYYHYRGKEQLIPVLFGMFEGELEELLNADTSELTSLEDYWAFAYLILEILYQYRFLQGLDFIRFDKQLERRRKRLHGFLVKCWHKLVESVQLDLSGGKKASFSAASDTTLLAENISLFIYSWISLGDLALSEAEAKQYLHEGVFRVFYQVAAAMGASHQFVDQCTEFRPGIKP